MDCSGDCVKWKVHRKRWWKGIPLRGKKVPVYEDSSIIEEAVIVEAAPEWSLMQTVGTGKTPEKYWPSFGWGNTANTPYSLTPRTSGRKIRASN